MRPVSRAWRAAEAVASILTALPLFFARHLPFSDLPEHLAAIATLSTYFDPRYRSAEYFRVQGVFRTTYLLYHAAGALLAHVLGNAERANLALLVLAAVTMIPALGALLRSVGADSRLSLVAGPLFWNRALAEGLLNYVASIPVALFALAIAVRHARHPRKRRVYALVALSVVLFYLHTSSFALFVVGATLAAWVYRARSRSRPGADLLARTKAFASRAPWLVVTAALAPVLMATNAISARAGGEHAGVVRFSKTSMLVETLFGWMHDVWTATFDERGARAMWAVVALLLVATKHGARSPRARMVAALLASLGVLAYFTLPNQVSYAFILDLRMAPYVGLLAVLVIARRRGTWANAVGIGLFAIHALLAFGASREMLAFERDEARHFDLVLRNLPRGKRLLTLVFQNTSERVIITPFVHFGSYYRARYGGVAGFSFSELPHWPVTYRPELAPPKKAVTFWDWNPCLFRNDKDGPYYDYVLVRGDVDPFANEPGGPRWRVIGMAKDWVLYEKSSAPARPGSDLHGPCPESTKVRDRDEVGRRPE